MNNRDVIKKAFNEAHISDRTLEKVKRMDAKSVEMELKKIRIRRRNSTFKIISCIAAVLLLCVFASNIIFYSDDDGTWTGGMEDTNENIGFSKEDDFQDYDKIYRYPSFNDIGNMSDDASATEYNVISENGRIYLEAEEYNILIDITDEISDGVCSGSFIYDEEEYHYEIKLTDGAYKVKIVKTEK